jgi:uncharacterized protein (DUF1697 family)
MSRYVALLRGVNVGGNRLISMADLRIAFEAEGFEAVSTYIQSGNVIFRTAAPQSSLEAQIEGMITKHFKVAVPVMVRSHEQLRRVITQAPQGFGEKPTLYHSDAIFLKAPLTSRGALRVVELQGGVDQAWPGTGVLYFARLTARRTQSKLSKIAGTPEYKLMTIRSWGTTTKLLTLLNTANEADA